MRRLPLIAVVLALALGGACTQQKDPTVAELREDISAELREAVPQIEKAGADCYARLLVPGDPDDDADEDLVDVKFSEDAPSEEVGEKIAAAAVEAREECDIAELPDLPADDG